MKKSKVTPFLSDPEVGRLYYEDALKKYEGMTAREMVWQLLNECGEKVYPAKISFEPVGEPDEKGRQRVRMKKDVTMYRIYHTLRTIYDKMDDGEDDGR